MNAEKFVNIFEILPPDIDECHVDGVDEAGAVAGFQRIILSRMLISTDLQLTEINKMELK